MRRRLSPPTRGAANNTAYIDTPGDAAPFEAMRNVWPYGRSSDRPRIGPCPGIVKAFQTRLPGRIQGGVVVSRAAGVASYNAADADRITSGVSRTSGLLNGQCWVLDPSGAMCADFLTSVGTLPYGAFCLGFHPTAKRLAFTNILVNPVAPGQGVSRVSYRSTDYLTSGYSASEIWNFTGEDRDPGDAAPDSATGIYANAVRVTPTFTYLCADRYIYVLRTSDGVYVQRYDLYGWAQEVMDCKLRPDGKLAVLFAGTANLSGPLVSTLASNTTPSGTEAGRANGFHFRSGVMLFDVDENRQQPGFHPLIQLQFGAKLDSGDANYEDHNYFRFSEHGIAFPRGYIASSMAVTDDNEIVVVRCNRGWGPTDSDAPDLTTPKLSVCKISSGTSAAVLQWENDPGSIEDAYAGTWGTYYNDIPHPNNADNTPADPHPTCDAVAVDPDGDVYVAGRRTSAGYNVHKLSGADGSLLWSQNCGPWISQHGLSFNRGTGRLVAVGKRTTDWEGAGGDEALGWELDPLTGDIVNHIDLGEAVDAFGVDTNADGLTAFVTGYVS